MTRFTGNTVEEAVQTGLASLNIPRSKAQITVLSKGKKGFLGFGKQLAEVEISALKSQPAVSATSAEVTQETVTPKVEEVTAQEVVTSPVEEDQAVQKQDLISEETSESRQPEAESVALVADETDQISQHQNFNEEFEAFLAQDEQPVRPSKEEAAEAVREYLEKIIYEMDIEAKVTAHPERRQIVLQIETSEAGRLIGYHGKVLKSLQLVGQNFLNDHFSRKYNLSLNVNDYLEHRTEALVELATRVARRVQESGREYRMEPMTNSERKIVHKTVAKVSGVESYSEGDDPHRYVVVVNRDNY